MMRLTVIGVIWVVGWLYFLYLLAAEGHRIGMDDIIGAFFLWPVPLIGILVKRSNR
jgi:hypothetical protein